MIGPGRPEPLAAPRRLALGVDKWVALERAAERTGLRLPDDLRLGLEPAVTLAVTDARRIVAGAEALLRQHGVLDDDGSPVPAVAANLAAIGAAARRVRVSVAGPDVRRLGYYWVDAELGGSVVRDDVTHTLSLFDARTLGPELLRQVPDREGEPGHREPFTAPLDLVGPVAALDDDAPAAVVEAIGGFVGQPPEVVDRLRDWAARSRAVLHVTVVGPRRRPNTLVWFLDRDGWWSGRVATGADGRRVLELAPRRHDELAVALGDLAAGAWT